MNSRRTFTLRVDDNLLDKLHYVANENRRSANNQIEVLIESFIADYEAQNGEIPLPEQK